MFSFVGDSRRVLLRWKPFGRRGVRKVRGLGWNGMEWNATQWNRHRVEGKESRKELGP